MNDRFKFRIWNGSEMHYNDFVVTATGYVGKITEEFLGKCVFNQEDLTADKECTLMQCTGLKDRNDKLIYEGDIVSIDDGELKGIAQRHNKFDEYYGCIEIKLICRHLTIYKPTVFAESEIIGNIYENKELLNE